MRARNLSDPVVLRDVCGNDVDAAPADPHGEEVTAAMVVPGPGSAIAHAASHETESKNAVGSARATPIDWAAMLRDFASTDPLAARDAAMAFSGVIEGTLRALGAYRQRDTWEDVIHDVLVALFEHAHEVEHPVAWLRRVTHHTYIGRQRREATRKRGAHTLLAGVDMDAHRAVDLAPDRDVALREELIELRRAVATLSPQLRSVIETVYPADPRSEPHTLADAASRLGVELHTVKNRLRSAISALSRTMRRDRAMVQLRALSGRASGTTGTAASARPETAPLARSQRRARRGSGDEPARGPSGAERSAP